MNRTMSTFLRTLACTSTVAALGAIAPGAHAQTVVEFPGPAGLTLEGVLYAPAGYDPLLNAEDFPAVVMLHGCSGIWSNREPGAENPDGTPDLQRHIEKWGLQLAAEGYVALAVDSYTPREPDDLDTTDLAERQAWQYQCSKIVNGVETNPNAGEVDPYGERVADARAAYDYLTGPDHDVIAKSVGLLGWSQGAQSVMVEAAATTSTVNTPRAAGDLRFATSVVYYPGCGTALGFGAIASGYWRPYADFRMNIGELDSFYKNCKSRVTYGQTLVATLKPAPVVVFQNYDYANHSFDYVSEDWPSAKCVGSATTATGDECAMNASDIDSLQFFDDHL